MFGYVRPGTDKLSATDKEHFQAAYCGLCHTLGRRYGLFARLFLNYDMVFLGMLLDGRCESERRSCLAHPWRKRPCAGCGEALDTAADYSVILLWWQIQDGIADHGFFRGSVYRLSALLLRRAYRRARERKPDFDAGTRTQLDRLHRLEEENCPSLDAAADSFACLLAMAAAGERELRRQRVLRQMLYHLGRWIYLADAADDLADDLRRGSYNPLPLRFSLENGALTEKDRQELAQTMDQSIRQMAAAFELADFGDYSGVIRSVVYEGLYLVGAAVLNGTFHRREKTGQRTE